MFWSTRKRIDFLEEMVTREIGYRDRSLEELWGIVRDLAELHGKSLVYVPMDPEPPRRWRLEDARP